jgi:hypothetical protein
MLQKNATVAALTLAALVAPKDAEAQYATPLERGSFTSVQPHSQTSWQANTTHHEQSYSNPYYNHSTAFSNESLPRWQQSNEHLKKQNPLMDATPQVSNEAVSSSDIMSSLYKIGKGLYQGLAKLDPLVVLGLGIGIGWGAMKLRMSIASSVQAELQKQLYPKGDLEVRQRIR